MSKSRVIGWVLSGLIAAFLIVGSASGKFTEWEGKAEMFAKLGWTPEVMFKIGIVEVVIAILFLIPRTAFLAAILLTGYLGGATATHVRVGDPFFVPMVIGVVVWTALGLRRPEVFRLALGAPVSAIVDDHDGVVDNDANERHHADHCSEGKSRIRQIES